MSPTLTPRQTIQKLKAAAEHLHDPALQQDLRQSAETIEYLLILLNECGNYIESNNEYNLPPRFIIAVREALA